MQHVTGEQEFGDLRQGLLPEQEEFRKYRNNIAFSWSRSTYFESTSRAFSISFGSFVRGNPMDLAINSTKIARSWRVGDKEGILGFCP